MSPKTAQAAVYHPILIDERLEDGISGTRGHSMEHACRVPFVLIPPVDEYPPPFFRLVPPS